MRKKTVLVIDDDEALLAAIVRQLEGKGWEVYAYAEPAWPDPSVGVVLSDWNPYGLGMVTRCTMVGVPVVIYTGTPEDVPDGLPVIAKPATSTELDAALRKAMRP